MPDVSESESPVSRGRRSADSFGELAGMLAARTGTDPSDWFPVFKARYGMEVVLRALRTRSGDGDVLTQLFTCCTAVTPVIASGLEVRYADVDPSTLSLDPDLVEGDGPVRAVMLQHTFGLIDGPSSRRLASAASGMGALLVEDCAHCVARMALDEGGRPLADVSVHSFGVEKMLPTRFGGAVWINPRLAERDPRLDAAMRGALTGLKSPSGHLDRVCRIYVNENRVLGRLPGDLGSRMRSWLTRHGWYEPPIADAEMRGRLPYAPMGMSGWMRERACAGLHGLDGNESVRRGVVGRLRVALADVPGISVPAGVLAGEPQPLLRFPLLAADTESAERLIASVRARGAYAERWYRPELFPGVAEPTAFGLDALDRALVPVSDDMTARCLCLPTDVTGETLEAMIRAVADGAGNR
ncbi:DegT/DnrJ/EryC1/StrS family aminotransferase [uncultured Bifidobacterium sp.]|uniref:DegT/DnrJ/EryC1/StrS family aminotransferase n=1 Tax=uncultured Bifidobacterium sp. TaxID=165187 RepID=UPI0028DCED68|nr:DegT/DnrJ/EryC1/StrS family aminotransferase [uncultured Bifidobacterium sp.]